MGGRTTRILLGALLWVVPFARAEGQPAVGYPKLGSYSMARGDGTPYLLTSPGSPWTWPLDSAVVAMQARWDHVILDVSPFTEYRSDVLRELRRLNPGIRLIAYATTGWWYNPNPAFGDTTVNFPWKVWQAVRGTNGILYSKNGQPHQGANTNLANHVAYRGYVTAEALADTIANVILRRGLWDGLFVDGSTISVWWAQAPGDSIDYVRAGYASAEAFNAGYAAGQRVFSQRLRDRLGPSFYLCGNGGSSGERDIYSGWMREDFPNQNGGTWEANMLLTAGGDPGYLRDDSLYVPPGLCWLTLPNSDLTVTQPNLARARFGLGSATLGEGVAAITGWALDSARGFLPWWLDEYAVDTATGGASTLPQHKGWLGKAIDRAYLAAWVGPGPDAVSNPDFEGDVTDGWKLSHAVSVPTTVTRDSTTSAAGLASARIHVENSGPYDWFATYGTAGAVSVAPGQSCSATLWAKASTPRLITIATASSGTDCASRTIQLDTAWRRYQVILSPPSGCTAQLHLSVGAHVGDVWVDDVHLQAGVMSVYRRDFENGVVLVNPTGEVVTAPLGGSYRRILGSADPQTNDGASVTEVSVPARDALFLIGGDEVAPATIRDLGIRR